MWVLPLPLDYIIAHCTMLFNWHTAQTLYNTFVDFVHCTMVEFVVYYVQWRRMLFIKYSWISIKGCIK